MADARISYAGISICTDARVTSGASDDELVIETASPMPVGTSLEIETRSVIGTFRVVAAHEGAPGQMRLVPAGSGNGTRPMASFIPPAIDPAARKKRGRQRS
jgi:hypothetical protein